MTWTIQPSEAFKTRYNQYRQSYPVALRGLVQSWTSYVEFLNRDIDPYDPLIEFKHVIIHGIVAITDGLTTSPDRVYSFPDCPNHVLHLLLIGHQKDEREEIIHCEWQIQNLMA
jgi:hypothetical protein